MSGDPSVDGRNCGNVGLAAASTTSSTGPGPLATGTAFLMVGLLPLIPFLIPIFPVDTRFVASAVAAGFAFFAVGAAKGIVLNRPVVRSGVETFLTGGGAALLAFLVGSWLQAAFGFA